MEEIWIEFVEEEEEEEAKAEAANQKKKKNRGTEIRLRCHVCTAHPYVARHVDCRVDCT